MPIQPAQSTDQSVLLALLKSALHQISTVKFSSAETTTRYNPPIGAVGGAGNGESATMLVLALCGITERTSRFLQRIASKIPKVLLWTVHDDQQRDCRSLEWKISRHNYRHLVLTLPGSECGAPQQLTAIIANSSATVCWRITIAP